MMHLASKQSDGDLSMNKARQQASIIYAFEKDIATITTPRTAMMDPEAYDNQFTLEGMRECPTTTSSPSKV
jgi:hypothetical protein